MVAGLTSNVGIPKWEDLENLTTVREVQALLGAPENAWRLHIVSPCALPTLTGFTSFP